MINLCSPRKASRRLHSALTLNQNVPRYSNPESRCAVFGGAPARTGAVSAQAGKRGPEQPCNVPAGPQTSRFADLDLTRFPSLFKGSSTPLSSPPAERRLQRRIPWAGFAARRSRCSAPGTQRLGARAPGSPVTKRGVLRGARDTALPAKALAWRWPQSDG